MYTAKTLTVAYAEYALSGSKAHASETAPVHGASGGVGIAALQIARARAL